MRDITQKAFQYRFYPTPEQETLLRLVKNMVRNRKLSLSISDTIWAELVRQLEYECQWYDRILVKIDQWFPSSKRCGHSEHIVEKLRLNARSWNCPQYRTITTGI